LAVTQRSRAYVWLAVTSALLVLLASGVAISRLGDDSPVRRVAAAPGTPAPTVTEPGSALGGGSASGPAASTSAETAATANPAKPGGSGQGNGPTATPSGTAKTASAARSGSAPGEDSAGSDARYGSAGANPGPAARDPGQAGGGEAAPPKPTQQPPEEMSLVGASVSAGSGDMCGVIGAALDSTSPEADVTVGTNPVVGDHPPSQGTGVALHGRFFHPPPSIPVLPG
jgi:hypothetical protein